MSEEPSSNFNASGPPQPGPEDQLIVDAARRVVGDQSPPEITRPALLEQSEQANPNVLAKKEWHEATEAAVAEANRSGKALSVLFMDANAFKDVNDTLGHDKGDEVIEKFRGLIGFVAHQFRTQADPSKDRPLDIIAATPPTPSEEVKVENEFIDAEGGHIGGDEFAVLCWTDEAGAQKIVTRLRSAFRDYLNQPENQQLKDIGLGLSIGTASLNSDDTVASLLKRADDAMYDDKLHQLPKLSPEQEVAFRGAIELLKQAGVRTRDIPKYLKKLG